MVVGNGLLAKAFVEYDTSDDIIIFASGVSNSKETSQKQFDREEKLLRVYLDKYKKNKYFIYFSTCSMYDTYFEKNAYTKHKLKMEQIIIENAMKYNIFRLSQVLGENNKNQLIGFLYNSIKTGTSFDLYDIERNIIDIADILNISKKLINSEKYINSIINVANPQNIKVFDLVKIIEKLCQKEANYTVIQKKGNFKIDVTQVLSIINKNKFFYENYLEIRTKKYYE